nr:MAG TPA: DNA-directed RNA polymerase [Caudoviricetes sp.]
MDEYIKREAVLRAVHGQRSPCRSPAQNRMLDCLKAAVIRISAADVAPVVHGLWMPIRESEMTGWDPAVAGRDPIGGYICSACKEEAVYDCNDEFVLSKYCPNCGAKMDGGDNTER